MGTRQQNACRWYCKSCTNDRTGKPWWNMPHAKKCELCGLAKGVAFKGNVPATGGAPSFSVKPPKAPWLDKAEQSAQVRIKELEAKVKELQTEPVRGGPSQGEPMCTDGPHGKEEEVQLRKRLKDVKEQLAFVIKFSASGEAKASAYAEALRAEKEDIHGKLQASRPMHAKLQNMSNRLKAAKKIS